MSDFDSPSDGSRRPRVDRDAARRFITQSIPVSAIIDENHPRVLNAKKYLMKNKLLADPSSSSTSTNQSQPSKIVKGRQQSQALRQGTSGQKAFHTHATHSAPTTPMRAQQQKKSIARIAQQAHQMQQRGPRNNSNNFGNSNSKFQARDSSGGFGDDSNGGESDGGSKPRFVMNKFNNKQQFQQQPRTGMGRGGGQNFHQQQQNSKFVWKKTNNNTNDFGGDGGDYGSGNPKFAHKKALRQNNYGDSNDDGYGGDGDDGSSNGFQPKFVMNKKQQFSNSNSDFDEAPVQKYIPKHLRNQQQNQQMQQQQYQLQMQQQQYQLPPRNANQQPFLVKKAPFVPKAYQNINVANTAQSARAKTNPNSNTRSPAAMPNVSAPRPITNAKSPAQSKAAKLQQPSRSATQPPTRSKAESAMISKSMKSGASASAAKKSTSSKQDRATSGSGLSALSHIQDFRSTFGITDVHWTDQGHSKRVQRVADLTISRRDNLLRQLRNITDDQVQTATVSVGPFQVPELARGEFKSIFSNQHSSSQFATADEEMEVT